MAVEHLKPGDPITLNQLEQLFNERGDHLRRYVIADNIPRRLQATLTPDDIMQEAWLDLCQGGSDSFRYRGPKALHGWLDEVVTHTMYDMLRHARCAKRLPPRLRYGHATSFITRFMSIAAKHRTPSSEFRAREQQRHLDEAFERLPERERLAVKVRSTSNTNRRALAHSFEQSEAAFKSLIARGRRRLRDMLFGSDVGQDDGESCD